MEMAEDYIGYLDATLRKPFETWEDFIDRARAEGLIDYVKR